MKKFKYLKNLMKEMEKMKNKNVMVSPSLSTLADNLIMEQMENLKNVVIHLLEKVDEKIFDNTLMKLGFNSIEIANSEISEKYYYLKLVYEFERGEKITNSSIKLDAENSCIYIDDTSTYRVDIFGEIEKLLLENKIIDREEIYTKSGSLMANHKIHDIDVSDIIKEIEFGSRVKSGYRGDNGFTNGAKEILTKHFVKFLMDKYKEELSLSENNSKKIGRAHV